LAGHLKTAKPQTLTVLWPRLACRDGNAELQRPFIRDLYPALDNTSVSGVPEHDVRAPFRTVVDRGAHRQAIRFFADLTQIFDGARKRQPSDFG
jgi:hypothetical protein